MAKLNYRIVGRRPMVVTGQPGRAGGQECSPGTVAQPPQYIDQVDIIWTHEDGFPPDTRDISIQSSAVDLVSSTLIEKAVEKKVINAAQADALRGIVVENFRPYIANPNVCILRVPDGVRKEIGDQINVPGGTPDSIISMALEEKRKTLAAALGVSE